MFLSYLYQINEPHELNTEKRDRRVDDSDITTCTKPAQPHPKFIVVHNRANYVLSFQQSWFVKFPWLHCSATLKGVPCFHCAKILSKKSPFASWSDPGFVSTGFRNWKRAVEKFSVHAKSHSQVHAAIVYAHEGNIVASQLPSVVARQQEEARHALLKIVGSIKYLARQWLAL